MNKNDYFSEDCIVKDQIYNSIKQSIICPICQNIFQNPLICSNCSTSFCQKCIKNKTKCENCSKENAQYKESISKNQLLSSLKYKCRNCLEEVNRKDIEEHLKSNCQNNREEKKKTLHEQYTSKKELKRFSAKELEKKLDKNEQIYILKSKKIKYNFLFLFSNNIR